MFPQARSRRIHMVFKGIQDIKNLAGFDQKEVNSLKNEGIWRSPSKTMGSPKMHFKPSTCGLRGAGERFRRPVLLAEL